MQLNPIEDEDPIIKSEFIQYYERLPDFSKLPSKTFVIIDPAASEKKTASFTAIVAVTVVWDKDDTFFYVHPNPINERLSLSEIKTKAILMAKTVRPGHLAQVVVEDIGSQRWLIQEISKAEIHAIPFAYRNLNKETKLRMTSGHMQEKRVFFSENGNKEIVKQFLGFGVLKHNDLADATAMAIITASEFKPPVMPEIFWVNW